MSAREWKPGDPIPRCYSGMPVTITWNEVALTRLLQALEANYHPGYRAMCDEVRGAMAAFTSSRPEEPEEPESLADVLAEISDRLSALEAQMEALR